ncbi:hypothetical protein GCM10027517_22990 [Phycicoccus ginsengisoli]
MTTGTAGSGGGSRRTGARGRLAPALGLVAAALMLAGCSRGDPVPQRTPPTPTSGTVLDEPLPARIANLPLVDQHGRHFTLASLRGKTVVLGDFLTLCQEVCPMTSVNLRDVAKAAHRDGRSDEVEVVEATVDPHRDTPARLAAYEKLFGAQQDWTLATGGQRPLDALWAYLGVYHQKAGEDVSPAPRDWWTGNALTYDVHHQDVVYVIDARGHARWLDDGTPNTLGKRPAGPMLRFLNNEGQHNLTAPQDPSWTVHDVEQAVTYVSGLTLP